MLTSLIVAPRCCARALAKKTTSRPRDSSVEAAARRQRPARTWQADRSAAGSTSVSSVSKVASSPAMPAHDQAPSVMRVRAGVTGSTTDPPGAQRATTSAGRSRTALPRHCHCAGVSPRSALRMTYDATSAVGSGRRRNGVPVGSCRWRRSRREIPQPSRDPPRAYATRYQRPAHRTRWCGSTRAGGTKSASDGCGRRPSPVSRSNRSRCPARTAAPTAVSVPAGMGGAENSHALRIAVRCTASTSACSRDGIARVMLCSARAAPSSSPATVVGAVCSATATATACSSSSSRGGSAPPLPSR